MDEQKLKPQSLEWSEQSLMDLYEHFLLTGTSSLSPYPKNYRENLQWRHQLLLRAKEDVDFRAQVQELFFRDPLFAFNAFFYTLNVRKRPRHHQPFTTYWYQDIAILKMVQNIKNGRDFAIEKSRDMGATWIGTAIYTWMWLNPEGGVDFLLGSRKQELVDARGDMTTLFEKMRYLVSRLPSWLQPENWSDKFDNFTRMINPETGAALTGESNNPNFSTGGRYNSVLFDEFGKWESTDTKAWTSAGDATPCRIAMSTPFGAFGQYYKLITETRIDRVTLHWSLHPDKAQGLYCPYPRPYDLKVDQEAGFLNWKGENAWLRSPWYDAECKRRQLNEIAQELDIDYLGAGRPVFDGAAGRRVLSLLRSDRKPLHVYSFGPKFELHEEPDLEALESLEGKLAVFMPMSPESEQIVAVDVVEGKEHGDFAVIKGLDRATEDCAFSYFSRIDEASLADLLTALFGETGWLSSQKADIALHPYVAIETNGPGLATFDICVRNGMTNLFMMPNFDTTKQTVTHQKGWRTTVSSRKKIVSAIKEWLLEGQGWTDKRCASEMTSFVYTGANRPEAGPGQHDDEVLAWGIALVVNEILPGGDWKPPPEKIYGPRDLRAVLSIDRALEPVVAPSREQLCFEDAQRKKITKYNAIEGQIV